MYRSQIHRVMYFSTRQLSVTETSMTAKVQKGPAASLQHGGWVCARFFSGGRGGGWPVACVGHGTKKRAPFWAVTERLVGLTFEA